jgi:hypothetical protein
MRAGRLVGLSEQRSAAVATNRVGDPLKLLEGMPTPVVDLVLGYYPAAHPDVMQAQA